MPNEFHRIRRLVGRLAVLIPLLLAVLCSGLWIRGAFYADRAHLTLPPRTFVYLMGGKYLAIVWVRENGVSLPPIKKYEFGVGTEATVPERAALWPPVNWSIGSTHFDPALATQHNLGIQWWVLVVCFAIYPVGRGSMFCVRGLRRRNRWTKGLCTRCGYDIRASSARCPECGEAIH